MAIVQLKDVVVERVNSRGYGVKVAEKYEVKGKPRKTTYTVWFESEHGLAVGDVVSLSGFLGAKVGDPWTGDDQVERRSVELSVNKPRMSDHPATAQAPTQNSWSTAPVGGGFDAETPF